MSSLRDDQAQLLVDENDQYLIGGAKLYPDFVPKYDFKAVPGHHLVIAWVDQNATEEVGDGDYIGVHQDGVLVS